MKTAHLDSIKAIEKKRWENEDIRRAAHILLHAEKNKRSFVWMLDQMVHWLIVLIVILGNVMISALLIIVSGLVSLPVFYALVATIGICFGWLIEIPLQDIEKLDKKRHILSRFFLPIVAVLNIYFFYALKIIIEAYSEIYFTFNALVGGNVYAVCFLLPHLLFWIFKK